jgi:tRNA A-37 threonylcarbamoyl transferase component Bud32
MENGATRIGAAGSARGAGQLSIGSILAHTFEIVRFIRAGGMGEVYEARHLIDGSRLAVKFIRPDLVGDERIRAMFVREAGILRRIRDDAVVSYEGLLQDEQGRSFLAMSYVDGPSLAERAQVRPLGTDEAMRLLTRLARGLARVHAEGTFHRDLSPDNILLPDGDLDRAVIIDFGIAKLGEPQAGTLVGGDIAGKASYMSPEQLGVIRREVDARSDIYSLALTIAAAVLGRSLRTGGSWAEVVEARRHVPDLDGIDEPLRGRLAHMLQPDPTDRPQSMMELLTAPQGAGRASSGSAPADRGSAAAPGLGRAGRRATRGAPIKLLPILGGLAALVLIVGVGYLFFAPIPPPEETAALPTTDTPPGAPAPPLDIAQLERAANQALAGLPCSELSARVADDGGVSVQGVISQPSDPPRIANALDGVEGLGRIDTTEILVESRPVCSAAALVDTAARAGGVGVRTNRADGVFRDGDSLVVHATVPPGPPVHLYVDYVDPGGDVVHLHPNPLLPDSMVEGGSEVRLGIEAPDSQTNARHYQLGEPYGRAVVVALASATPLFSAVRQEVEPATVYLPALEQSLAAQGGEVQGGWQYLEIVAGE